MKKYGIIGIVFVGVAVICAFTFRGHKEADYLLTDVCGDDAILLYLE